MKRSTIIFYSILGLLAPLAAGLLIAMVFVFLNARVALEEPLLERVAVVTETSTGTKLTRDGFSQELVKNTDLQAGDRIRVPARGSVEVVWNEYGRTLLDGKTDLIVDTIESANDKFSVRLRVNSGRIWTRLQKLLELGSDFTVRTSDVVATVRGTSFGVERTGSGVQIKVTDSKVGVARFPSNAVLKDLETIMQGSESLEAGSLMNIADGSKGVPQPQPMTETELDDAFLKAGDLILTESQYRIYPDASAWVIWAIRYISEHPEVLNDPQALQEFIEKIPKNFEF